MILLLPVFDFSNIVICQWFGEKKKKKKKKGKKERKKGMTNCLTPARL